MRILIVEDDHTLNAQMAAALKRENYAVDSAFDGEEGHFLGDTEPYDAIILDLGLPAVDGLTVLSRWRLAGLVVPVLILTARDDWSEKVAGFDAGADDYVTKPFQLEEVLARIRALIRRAAGHASAVINCGTVRLDPRGGRVTVDGLPIMVTAQELRILSYLMHNMDKVISRSELNEHIHGQDWDINSIRDSNTIDVLIGRIRKKIPFGLIQTVRGVGYRLSEKIL
ncbi:MAG: response regulator transcription factor [Paracoccaceae bacterium]